jgi:hypothetical protein
VYKDLKHPKQVLETLGNEFCIETDFESFCKNRKCPTAKEFSDFSNLTDQILQNMRKDENFKKSEYLKMLDFFETYFQFHHQNMLRDSYSIHES